MRTWARRQLRGSYPRRAEATTGWRWLLWCLLGLPLGAGLALAGR